MSKLIANVDDYDIEEIEKKMELMSSECVEHLGELNPKQTPADYDRWDGVTGIKVIKKPDINS